VLRDHYARYYDQWRADSAVA